MSGWTLAIETSAAPSTIALAAEGAAPLRLAFEGELADVARHLLSGVDRLARKAAVAPSALTRIVLGVGPGSFTGMRVGASAARVLAAASRASLAPHASTLAIAAAAPASARRIAVALDALRGDLALALYERRGAYPVELEPPRLLSASAARDLARAADVVVSNAPAKVGPLLGLRVELALPDAARLLELDRAGAPPRASSAPIYLRASAAEERR